ncbi:hypothetical protein IB244_21170 [Rhizobium sp. RHZ02]|uniref:hypothetical protein n=1 Tax=Rhizobium sp. RHZ02 TaxID=2769306 RepID=UPI00177C14A1|nr:hypothetical protein [Rhizobium sp. RHZ02]MBD9454025.1 hypothetical protein [Rhizobium sp. RHZ02]
MTQDIRQAILDAANSKAERGTPISLLEIGPLLLKDDRYTQDEIVNALYAMESDGLILMLEGNRIQVVRR